MKDWKDKALEDSFPKKTKEQEREEGKQQIKSFFGGLLSLAIVYARGLALGILASLATVFALSWAEAFLVPLLLGIVIAYTLNPLVAWLERVSVPRSAGTVIVMAGMIAALALGTYSLRGQVQTIIEQLPEAATEFSTALARVRKSQNDTLQKIQNAATEVETAAARATGGAAPKQPATHVVVDLPKFRLSDYLWAGSMGAVGAIGQAAMVVLVLRPSDRATS